MTRSAVRSIARASLGLLSGALLLVALPAPATARASVQVPGQRTELDSLVRAPGGGLVAVGTTGICAARSEHASCPPNQVLLVGLRGDGKPDPGFGTGGVVTTTVPGGTVKVSAATRTSAGDTVVTGTLSPSRGGAAGSKLVVIRYLPDGRLDPGFGAGGIVTTAPPGAAYAQGEAVATTPEGDVLVAGDTAPAGRNPSFLLARLDPDGGLDPSFGEGGFAVGAFATGLGSHADAVAATEGGDIVVGGGVRTGPSEAALALARYLPDGQLDPGFGAGGTLTTSPVRGEFVGAGVASLIAGPPGGVVALGFGQAGEHTAPRIELLDIGADGVAATSTLPFGAPGRPGFATASLLPDGEALLAGTEEESAAGRLLILGRFAAGGRAEGSFRSAPVAAPGGGRYIGGSALLGAGRGMIVGTTVRAARCPGAVPRRGAACHAIALRRYRPDGSLARNFGEGGTVVIPPTPLYRRSGALADACGALPSGGRRS